MRDLYRGLNIVAIILAIVGIVLCFISFFSKKESPIGIIVDHPFTIKNNLFIGGTLILIAIAIWIGSAFNMHLGLVERLNNWTSI